MSGHSKWATIKRQKGLNDAKRGVAFTKLSMAITIAVREGGGIGDPSQNFRLRLAVDKARSANMPKDNIQKAIDRGTGMGDGAQLESGQYEGFGPGGVALIVNVLTDNKLRTQQQVRTAIEKNGGTLGASGAVSYMFKSVGEFEVLSKKGVDKSVQELEFIDGGVEEIEEVENGGFVLRVGHDNMSHLRDFLISSEYEIIRSDLVMHPTTKVEISEEHQTKLSNLVDALEEIDEVTNVFVNAS